jgi:hypothetical protein
MIPDSVRSAAMQHPMQHAGVCSGADSGVTNCSGSQPELAAFVSIVSAALALMPRLLYGAPA